MSTTSLSLDELTGGDAGTDNDNRPIFRRKMPKIQRNYVVAMSANEIEFLRAFIQWMLDKFNDPEYLLELTTLFALGHRFRQRFAEPKDCKINLQANELLGLKRMLWLPDLENQELNNLRNNLLGRIDQLTPNIF